MALAEPAHRAAGLLQDQEYVRVVCHADGDGLAAAALLARALQREGVDYHVTAQRELSHDVVEALEDEAQACLVLLDLPPDGLDLDEAASRVVTLDHHPVDGSRSEKARRTSGGATGGEGVLHVSAEPRADGSYEACAATVAYVVAQAMSRRNVELFPLAVAGMVADRQHLGGFKGLNAELAAEAAERGLAAPVGLLADPGSSLVEAVAQSPDPYVRGLAGRARDAKAFLDELGLDAESTPAGLDGDAARRLASALALKLVDQGAAPGTVDALVGPRYDVGVPGVHHAHDLAELLTMAALEDAPGLGLAMVLHGAEAAVREVRSLARARRRALFQAMLRVDRAGLGDGAHAARFVHDDVRALPRLASLVHASLVGDGRLLAGAREDGTARVEARRPRAAAAETVDLRRVLRRAGRSLELEDVQVGGHDAAAWARVPADALDDVLDAADELLGEVP